jgi:hypothetical protein
MRRPHNLQIVGRQSHPFIGQFINAAEPPSCGHRSGPPSWGHCGSGQHVRLETTSPLPSPEPPLSPVSTPSPPPVPPPALAPPQIRMLPVPLPPRPVVAHARAPVSVSTTRYRHSMPYYPEAEPFYDLFAAFACARSRSPPASPLPPRATPSPPTLHFPSSPPPGPTTLAGWNSNSSNDTGNEASQNSSSSSSERDLDLHDTEPGLTDATDENIVTLPHRRQNFEQQWNSCCLCSSSGTIVFPSFQLPGKCSCQKPRNRSPLRSTFPG